MKNLLLLFALLTFGAHAQPMEGVVTYERKSHWTKIIARLPYLSREEKERVAMTWKNDDGPAEKMKLVFSEKASLFTYLTEQGQSEDGNWSWRQDDYLIYRNYEKDRKTEVIEMLGKTYVVDDSLNTPKWKVLNQIKDVAGYICLRAEMQDAVRGQKLTAWFAQDLPVPAGPERVFGLPGLILELDINDGDVVLEATKVDLKAVVSDLNPPKSKGKRISDAQYDALIRQHINDSVKANRNPFWAIRY